MFDKLKKLMGIAYPLSGGPEPVIADASEAKQKIKNGFSYEQNGWKYISIKGSEIKIG